MIREKILKNAATMTAKPLAFQALWDGDSDGWMLKISAVLEDGTTAYLGWLRFGGDLRIFNGQIPPWPEADFAKEMARELMEIYGGEFYFPSPHHPDIDCPEWAERHLGIPCRRCHIPLRPDSYGGQNGICHFCQVDEEREQREAKWTAEERAGARCHICGKPAHHEMNGGPVCHGCFDKYEINHCEDCNGSMMAAKSEKPRTVCRRCRLQRIIDSLTDSQKETIVASFAQGRFAAMDTMREVSQCGFMDRSHLIHMLGFPQEEIYNSP
jgi:hypothetical protein